jgi:hypothetical protein
MGKKEGGYIIIRTSCTSIVHIEVEREGREGGGDI